MQQVNLYTDAFKPKKIILPLSQIALIPLGLICALLLISFWLETNLSAAQSEVAIMEAKNNSLAEKVSILDERASRMRKDDALVSANKRLTQKLAARKSMMETLDTVVVKDDEGFSTILISLARQNIEALWLQRILIESSGKQLRLVGLTQDGDAVPAYLQQLRKEQSFLGRTFTGFELERNEGNSKLLNFSLYTSGALDKKSLDIAQLDTSKDIVSFAAKKVEAKQ